jgi:hypothetical protein
MGLKLAARRVSPSSEGLQFARTPSRCRFAGPGSNNWLQMGEPVRGEDEVLAEVEYEK